jgi:cytochrome c553
MMPQAQPRQATILMSLAALAILAATLVRAGETAPSDPADLAFFESKIRPVLVKNCYECHSSDAKTRGGLNLDSRAASLAGGDTGPAVVPGDPASSLLLSALRHQNDLKMPPKAKLPGAVIADFEIWIARGAADPRAADTAPVATSINVEEASSFWAYQAPIAHPIPNVSNTAWPLDLIDHFVLSKLEETSLAPNPDAPTQTLLRRIHFDLTGLPPSPAQVAAFAANPSREAYTKIVDDLLASPHFGERWGRHWLDVARFAESSGRERNIAYPHAWRYRDYVIDAFNTDLPFDQFIVEQLAGDLLPFQSEAEQARLITATGFLAVGPKSHNEQNARQFAADLIDEQIDATTQAFLATTVACARCHDHKFDPIPTADYYAMAGIFHSTETNFGTVPSAANRRASDLLYIPGAQSTVGQALTAQERSRIEEQAAQARQQRDDLVRQARDARRSGAEGPRPFQILTATSRVAAIDALLDSYDTSGEPHPLAMGTWDIRRPADAPLLVRGEIDQPAHTVPRGFIQILHQPDQHLSIPPNTSGRLELAQAIASPKNPLAARVYANRIWYHLTGAGIVRSLDNFGTTGTPPTHPELLDHLSLRLVEGGWSTKSLIRAIVLSRTYQMASTHRADAFAADPDNNLLWRIPPRRLQGEAIRDAMLAVAGTLELSRPLASPVALAGDGAIGQPALLPRNNSRLDPESLRTSNSPHRSVYLPVVRDALPEALDLFDFAEPTLVTGARETTNVPSQALYLLNSDFVHSSAESLAARLLRDADKGPGRLELAYLLCFGRYPDTDEAARANAFFKRFHAEAPASGIPQADIPHLALTTFCQALLATAEFRILD